MNKIISMAAAALLAIAPCVAPAQSKAPQLNSKNVDKVLKAMTLEEKARLLVGGTEVIVNGKLEKVPYAYNDAVGQSHGIERLGIAETYWTDGPAGVRIRPTRQGDSRTFYATGFPVATLLASSWDTDLVERVGRAMGEEVKDYGCDIFLSPALCIHRNPLCGRNFEYYSEDPLIAGAMATAMTKGVQSNGVGVSIKHFAANNCETFRTENTSNVSQRALREIYLRGFERVVKDAKPWTIMSSYNKINGVYTQEDYNLLTGILRNEWGFKGMVETDWTGTRNTVAQVHAGNDLMMPGNYEQQKQIVDAVNSGKLSIKDVDRNVRRILELVAKTPSGKGYKAPQVTDLKAHAQVSRKAAEEGMILLKNNGNALPLASGLKVALYGRTSYYLYANGWGSGDVNKVHTISLFQGLSEGGYKVSPELSSIYNSSDSYFKVTPENARLRAEDCDVAIVTFGRNAGEGGDRHVTKGDWYLTEYESQSLKNIVDAFHAKGKKVIVVLNTGGVIETATWSAQPDAILLAWQPGQEGGYAIADILSGKANPSGKLTSTFPVKYEDVPSQNFPSNYNNEPFKADWKNYGYVDYDEGIYVGYRHYLTKGVKVAYPFGYGLSYTTFAFSGVKAQPKGNVINVTVTVKNTGSKAGKEVAEVYVAAPKGKLDKPLRELKGFAKTRLLNPGESQTLVIPVRMDDLASFDEANMQWLTDAGEYTAEVGSDANTILGTAKFNIKKAIVKKAPTKL